MDIDNYPLISIIVPAYNAGKHLNRCVDSLISQNYKNLEIIIIDDGSTDNTAEIVDSYVQADRRVRGVHQENKGLVAVRNLGIELASGEYIGFVDSDDSVSVDMYERLLINAKEYDAEISGCGIRFLFDHGLPIDHWGTGRITFLNQKEALEALLLGNWMEPSLCNKIYRKDIIIDSCMNLRIVNNEDLLRSFVVFSRAKKVINEDFCGYFYFRHANSMSNNADKANIVKDILDAQELILSECSKEIEDIALRSYFLHAISIINKLAGYHDKKSEALCIKCKKIIFKNIRQIVNLTFLQKSEVVLILLSINLYKRVYLFMKKYDKRRI